MSYTCRQHCVRSASEDKNNHKSGDILTQKVLRRLCFLPAGHSVSGCLRSDMWEKFSHKTAIQELTQSHETAHLAPGALEVMSTRRQKAGRVVDCHRGCRPKQSRSQQGKNQQNEGDTTVG